MPNGIVAVNLFERFSTPIEKVRLMSQAKITVLCGSCKCAVKSAPHPQPHDQVSCPRCGRSDRFDKVMDFVKEHMAQLAHQSLSKSLASAVRGNSAIKFKANKPRNQSFRWISDTRL